MTGSRGRLFLSLRTNNNEKGSLYDQQVPSEGESSRVGSPHRTIKRPQILRATIGRKSAGDETFERGDV